MKKVFATVFLLFSIIFNIFGYILPGEWFADPHNYVTVLFWITTFSFGFYLVAYYSRYHSSETLVPKFDDCENSFFIGLLKVLWGIIFFFACLALILCFDIDGQVGAVQFFNRIVFLLYLIHYVIYSTVLETRKV